MATIPMTLGFVIKGDKVLLGMKKRGFGKDRFNGFGGKVKADETPEQAMKREMLEECSVNINDLRHSGRLTFTFEHMSDIFEVNLFHILDHSGVPEETEEMLPRWFKISEVPYEKMWSDDKLWLPQFLSGKNINGTVHFDKNDNVLKININEG